MADRVAVLNAGRLEQFSAPTEVYDRPATLFVNTFVGSANVFSGRLGGGGSGGERAILLDTGETLPTGLAGTLPDGARVTACIRPEHLRVVPDSPAIDGPAIEGTVAIGLPLGSTIVHEIRTKEGRAIKISEPRSPGAGPRPPGERVRIRPISPAIVSVFAETLH